MKQKLSVLKWMFIALEYVSRMSRKLKFIYLVISRPPKSLARREFEKLWNFALHHTSELTRLSSCAPTPPLSLQQLTKNKLAVGVGLRDMVQEFYCQTQYM